MGKKKHDDHTIPIDIASSNPVYNGYPISKHRSCWIHVLGYLKACGKKITKQEAQKLRRFSLIAPCFLGTIPCRARSKRRVKSKKLTSELKNKIDSGSFECYLETLWSSFPEDKRTSFTYLDCQWFAWYRKVSYREKVLSWIKRKQIFSKNYVLVPIVCWGHWSLLIFCHFGESLQSKTRTPCMLLLDSLQMSDPMRLEPDIRRFMFDIYKAEGRPENKQTIYRVPLLVPKVPQQRNGKECGNFVLYFIKLFVESAPENFSIEGYPYFMKKDWFNAEAVERYSLACDFFKKSTFHDNYPLLGRFWHITPGHLSGEWGSQTSGEHLSLGAQSEQPPIPESAAAHQSLEESARDGSLPNANSRQQEQSNTCSVNISILSAGGTPNSQETNS